VFDWIRSHETWLIGLAIFSVITLIGSAVLLPWVIVRAPTDYFSRSHVHALPWEDKHPAVRVLLIAAKNLLGVFLLLAGILMLVLPGQGILTIIAALALMDFPGRHALVCRLVSTPPIIKSLNWIRRKRGREPFIPTSSTAA
jgi:hypothetical protein